MQALKQQVAQLIEQEPTLLAAAIAERLAISEFEAVAALPDPMVALAPGEQAQSILENLVDFGPVTTIVHSFGSIFEVKAPFPKGKLARGYYNLMGKEGEMHGHLNLERVKNIALVSKPFMGRESHYFGFFCEQGNNIFKIYLGRNEKRELLSDQVESFQQWQRELRA
ncbi:heme utilization cystosolic carrier protein HutX [Vibrio ostreicida]|uniref:Heme utilization cystosolic carrier protein HutX n=1 Tax=Vibrio ostreicida TaxID=526588 RepID=A0ABT8C1I8_9VIBR|nr:heme utilization cystosolic carrier protein HutX [Vibrio ostreicida]MDN3612524.1 heme utilization cystosolic carrier protein HutX [Vibrio ostreicida]NPD09149.1 heme utilization cystosolic carrier protein HutX [Vibrio ostreicida]